MCKISIVVPIYNVEAYLAECLDSIVRQTNKDFEVILVNDGSTDNSGKIVREYQQKHSCMKLIEQENRGLSEARNAGLRAAKGEYIVFLDSDDYVEEQMVDELIRIVGENEFDLLSFAGKKVIVDSNGERQEEHFGTKHNDLSGRTGVELFDFLQRNGSYSSCVVLLCIKKTLIDENSLYFFPHIIHEDHLFTFYLYMCARCCGIISREFYNYRIRENSIMTNKSQGYLESFKGMDTSCIELFDWYKKNAVLNKYKLYMSSIIRYIRNVHLWTGYYYNNLTENEKGIVCERKKLHQERSDFLKAINTCKISVIVPAYNVELYLKECLDSILRQDLDNYEIIIVNDGSTDGTRDIIYQYAEQYESKIWVCEQKNQGQSVARNSGLDIASGEYILFVDSDDYLENNIFKSLIETSEGNKLDVLLFAGQRVVTDSSGIQTKEHYAYEKSDLSGKPGAEVMAERLSEQGFYDVVWLQFVRRDLIEKKLIRFYPGIIHEDHLYTFQLLMCSERCGYISEEMYNYRIRPYSTMTTDGLDDRRFIGWGITFLKMFEFYNKAIEDSGEQSWNKEVRNYILYCAEMSRNIYLKLEEQQKNTQCNELYGKVKEQMLKFCKKYEKNKLVRFYVYSYIKRMRQLLWKYAGTIKRMLIVPKEER